MAFTAKLTVKLGAGGKGDVAIGAGAAEAMRDVISINIDASKMTKGEAIGLIEKARDAVFAANWPIN